MQNKMRYFQLINPIKGKYPLIGEKEIYKEENNIQILILKRDIIANHPNEQMEIAHDLSLEDVQREQAVILKGIAQQILSMNVPSFDVVDKLFQEFGKTIDDSDTYSRMYKAIEASVYINDEIKQKQDLSQVTHKFAHYAFKHDTALKIRNAVIDDLCR